MSSYLIYGDQAFGVSNSAKDLPYEMVVEIAKRSDSAALQRLKEEGRLVGCYGVSGVGFDLQAFSDCFGGKTKLRQAVTAHFEVVRELCADERCTAYMTKLFEWSWFLLDGGRCKDASGIWPELANLPSTPATPTGVGGGQNPATDPSPEANCTLSTQSLSESQAAYLWFALSVGQAIGSIGCVVGPVSLLSPLWTEAPWSWPAAILGIAGTAASLVLLFVFSRLKRGL
jgi:hypothetical protein